MEQSLRLGMRVPEPGRMIVFFSGGLGSGSLRPPAVAAVELAHPTAHDGHLANGAAVPEAPNGICTFPELGVKPGNDVFVYRPAAADHGVYVVAPRCAHRREVYFRTQATFVGVDNQGADVAAYVQHEGVRRPGPGPGILEGLSPPVPSPVACVMIETRTCACVTWSPGWRPGSWPGCRSRRGGRPGRGTSTW